jgi:tetratricopeptide (TPR) repeat protein
MKVWSRALLIGGLAFLFPLHPSLAFAQDFLPTPPLYQLPAIQAPAQDIGSARASGKKFLLVGNYCEALESYRCFPHDPECRLGMGLCYYGQQNFGTAKALFLEVKKRFPTQVSLQETLNQFLVRESARLKRVLLTPPAPPDYQRTHRKNLVDIFEVLGYCDESPEYIISLLPPDATWYEIQQLAHVLASAEYYVEAAKLFERSAPVSPHPREAWCSAIDCYLQARDYARVSKLLADLGRTKPGFDLDQRKARLLFAQGASEKAHDIFRHGSAYYLQRAANERPAASWYFKAADLYLDGELPDEALAILEKVKDGEHQYELDQRLIRAAQQKKQNDQVVAISAKYPGDLRMQLSRGQALRNRRYPVEARKIYETILQRFPHHRGAGVALKHIKEMMSWSADLSFKSFHFGAYQDAQLLRQEALTYNHRGCNWTTLSFAHTRTDTVHPTPGKPDYREDIVALKIYHRFLDPWALGLWKMYGASNYSETDHGNVSGATVFHYPNAHWAFALKISSADFRDYGVFQLCSTAKYRMHKFWRVALEGIQSTPRGALLRTRPPRGYQAFNGAIEYTPKKRFGMTLGGWGGKRQLFVDDEGRFFYNRLDILKSGGHASVRYTFSRNFSLSCDYSQTTLWSESQEASNQAAGAVIFHPRYTLRMWNTRAHYLF